MADPYKAYQDLIWGRWNPLGDPRDDQAAQPETAASQDQSTASFDPSPSQPTDVGILGRITPFGASNQDQSAAFLDPSQLPPSDVGILGRITPANASAQDQSAAFLDPSAFAPPADLGVVAPPPPGAAKYVTPDDDAFYAPAGTDFTKIYNAGRDIAHMTIPDQIFNTLANIGHGGTYDFQRIGGKHPEYANASNVAVGTYMNSTGYSWPATDIAGRLYGWLFDKNGLPPDDETWWRSGYDAASNGQLPKKSTP
jgi:hypothetical protein